MRILIKILLTACIITAVSEIGKRSSWVGAILASLPLTSILAMIWLYWDTRDAGQVSRLSYGILWAIIPSLLFFVILPALLRIGVRFSIALPVSCLVMFLAYSLYVIVLRRLGISVL